MAIHSSNPLGSDEATDEYAICFLQIRKRVRYWISTLEGSNEAKPYLFGAVVALRSLWEQPSTRLQGFIATSDELEMPEESWFDADDGLKTVQALAQHIQENPDAVPNADEVIKELEEFRSVLSRLSQESVPWHLAVDF